MAETGGADRLVTHEVAMEAYALPGRAFTGTPLTALLVAAARRNVFTLATADDRDSRLCTCAGCATPWSMSGFFPTRTCDQRARGLTEA
jgi:hypothetical protein